MAASRHRTPPYDPYANMIVKSPKAVSPAEDRVFEVASANVWRMSTDDDEIDPESGCRLMEWHTKTINKSEDGEQSEKEKITDASCYSHSPPDLPLDQYNDYRRQEFDKGCRRRLLQLLPYKVNARDKYFDKIHARYPIDGPLESMYQISQWQAHRQESPARYDPKCNCANRGNCNQCLD